MIAEKVEQNNAKQATFKQANGRYKQCPPEQIGSALVWCTEYVNSKGAGYQNIIKIDTATSTIIKSFVFGATEGEEWRILDLILVKPEETATITAQRL
ncbi:MAG: hypothetical protein IH948_06175 [Bacteroidetes bacterium]|nr:hypothetical protein [Bacteroidota bacterium]